MTTVWRVPMDLEWWPHPGPGRPGVVTLTRDGEEPDWWRVLSPAEIEDLQLSDIEANAACNPDCEWLVSVETPSYGVVVKREGPGRWVITDYLDGYADTND